MVKTPPNPSLLPGALLADVLRTEALDRRPARPPNHAAENGALLALAQALADSPGTILQTLAETILTVFGCGSAGVSLLTADGQRIYWPAVAGAWKPQTGDAIPRAFSPCGDVLDFERPLLFQRLEERYTYFKLVSPPAVEALLVPFYSGGRAVGTIWAVMHPPAARKFDREDQRLLTDLSRFASAAHGAVVALGLARAHSTTLREANTVLLVSSLHQHELTAEADQMARRLEQLQQMTAAFSEALTPPQVAAVVVNHGVPALGGASGTVLVPAEDGQSLAALAATAPLTELDAQIALTQATPASDALRSRQPVWIETRAKYLERYPHLAEEIAAGGHEATVALPMLDQGSSLGVVAIGFDRAMVFGAEAKAYGLILARLCAQALERARLYEGERQARAGLEARVHARTLELEQSSAQLRDLSARSQGAREEERTRVSRELHDQLGGALTALKMDIARIRRHTPPRKPPNDLGELMTAVDNLIDMTRKLATELRPSLLDHFGLGAALEWQLQDFENRFAIKGRLETIGTEVGLDKDVATGVFRLFQETLTNVARHAQATEIAVQFEFHPDGLELRVQDNGQGFDPATLVNRKSLGLVGMRERVRLMGGDITINSEPGQGTLVVVTIPLTVP